jgi:ribulose-5-phosphate 4-epimerase/fuculose-1-phosphate aldolase
MTGRNIDMGPYDAVRLYNDFGGVVLDESEGEAICEALGVEGKGVILQNHGILSVSSGIEATVAYFVRLEGLCETQLLADAAGIKSVMDSGDREEIFRRAGGDSAAWRDAQALYEALDAETQGDYKL